MPRTRSNLSPAKVPKVAEASRLSSSQNQKQDASATLSSAPKGRNIPAHGNALGNRPPTNPSPEGAEQCWPFVRLAEAGVISGGLTKNSKRGSNELQVSYLRVGNVYQNELRLDEIKTIGLTEREFAKTRLEKGDLLIVEGNGSKDQIGRLAIWDGRVEPCVHQNHLIRVRLSERVLPKFAVYWFSSHEGRARIEHVASSTSGLYTLSVSKIGSLELPLPPLSEQRRIVARIEELFSRLDAGVAALRHAKAQLQRYRQSILAVAVTGQLTQAWREQHPDTEPAAGVIARMEAPPRPNRYKSRSKAIQQGHPALSVGNPGTSLPKGWAWAHLVEIARMESGHTPSRNHPEWWDGDIPWIGIADAREHYGTVIHETFQHTNEEGLANSASRLLPAGTVCISRTASVGYVTVMGCAMATSQDFVNWIPTEAVTSEWLQLVFQADTEGLRSFGSGSVHKTIYFPEWLSMHAAIPPLAEQHQIVAEVEARTTAIDHLEAELNRQIARSTRLRQSTLATAFSGKL